VRALLDGLPAGSYLALYDGSDTSPAFKAAQQVYNQTGAAPYHLRSPQRIAQFFDGLELVEPGVVSCSRWRPEPSPLGPDPEVETFGGIGRKPVTGPAVPQTAAGALLTAPRPARRGRHRWTWPPASAGQLAAALRRLDMAAEVTGRSVHAWAPGGKPARC